jgi:hypothetical protein
LENVPKAYLEKRDMACIFSFFAGSQKNFQLALRGPNLLASLEACKLRQGISHQRTFFQLCFILA